MEVTPEMKAALEKQMTAYLEEYFNANASDALREKVKAENKTVAGAYKFIESVVRAFSKAGCCAMPDALAYNLLMHYMEDEKEGATYRDPKSIQADIDAARKKEAEAKKKAAEAEAEAKKEAEKKAAAAKKAELKAKKEAEKKAAAEALRQKVAEENANALIRTSAKALREGEKAVETEEAERARTIAQMKKAEKLKAEKRNAEAVERIVLEQTTFAF